MVFVHGKEYSQSSMWNFLKTGVLPIILKSCCSFWLMCLLTAFIFTEGIAGASQGPAAIIVDYVVDGDSLVVRKGARKMEVRLWGIDAPEYDQPDSIPAKNGLKKMVMGQKGVLYIKYQDRYGRYVSVLKIEDLNVNEAMVAAGYSWVYDRYCREPVCQRWKHLQAEAKEQRRGLWSGKDPVPPWQWKASR